MSNSINLHSSSFVAIESTADSNEFTYPVATGHEHNDNIIIETYCVNALNKMMPPNNNKLFCSANSKEFITINLHPYSFVGD